MAGKIVADTLETGAGADIPTSYVVNGSAKAWANLNGSTFGLRNSNNISSAVDDGTGDYTFNFSNSMSAADYSVQAGEGRTASTDFYFGFTNIINLTASSFNAQTGTAAGSNIDFVTAQLSVQGDLA